MLARDGAGIVRLRLQPGEEMAPSKMIISARADVLQVLDCGQMALEATSSSSPGVIRPIGADNYIYVVMPMFVQW